MSRVSVQIDEGQETDIERRRSDRAGLIVRVDYSTVDELFSEFTRDVNEGGIFIETEKPRPIGTEVSLHFNLPGGEESVKTTGTVVRVCKDTDDEVPGMGIEFEELPAEARGRINQLIRALRSTPSPS